MPHIIIQKKPTEAHRQPCHDQKLDETAKSRSLKNQGNEGYNRSRRVEMQKIKKCGLCAPLLGETPAHQANQRQQRPRTQVRERPQAWSLFDLGWRAHSPPPTRQRRKTKRRLAWFLSAPEWVRHYPIPNGLFSMRRSTLANNVVRVTQRLLRRFRITCSQDSCKGRAMPIGQEDLCRDDCQRHRWRRSQDNVEKQNIDSHGGKESQSQGDTAAAQKKQPCHHLCPLDERKHVASRGQRPQKRASCLSRRRHRQEAEEAVQAKNSKEQPQEEASCGG